MGKKSKFMKVINLVLNILLVVFFIGTVYMILWRIFGDSPTDFQIISWVVGLFSVAVFKLFTLSYNMNREVGEIKIGVRSGFRRIKEDMQEIKILVKKK